MLYTRKGDAGTTKDFKSGPGERKSKSSCQTEALGALDELNSFLGLVKIKSAGVDWRVGAEIPSEIVGWAQNCLFSIQAEVAGADKKVGQNKVMEMEQWIDRIEKELPPIKTFFISGGTELAALFDVSRTLARKAERRVVGGAEAGEFKIDPATLAFLNRLSSLFYALARLSNHKSGIKEQPPTYN
ncbi:MAG: cob(I)yrinic acid a,c-diamide adenosyltransferase [Candidatus Taylorbacteria bacterium]|nr:cob(I)yrinic acid a,c-diamide adenosyltransferase [Candidatus Taylorbacteria bacterium]